MTNLHLCLRQALLAALDLDELADQLPSAPVEIVHDRLLLGLKTQTALALAVGADPVVGDKATARTSIHWANPVL